MRAAVFLQGLIAFLIVAFGQPSFAPWLGPVAAACGYAIFWRAVRIYPFSSQRFWRGSLWYSSISFVQLSWMSSIEYQGLYIIGVWVGLSVWLGLQFGVLSILIPYNKPLSFLRVLAISSIWTLIEWARFYVVCGYSWNLSGMALSNFNSLQFAAVFGILGLTFWVILTNLVALKAFIRKGIPRYLTWGAFALFPYIFGALHIQYHRFQKEKHPSPPYTSLLIQTGLLPDQKAPLQGRIRHYINPYDQWVRILQLAKEGKDQHLDLIILPESTVPYWSNAAVYHPEVVKEIFEVIYGPLSEKLFPKSEEKVTNCYWAQTLSNLFQSEVIIGFDHHEPFNAYNSAFHFKPHANGADRYDKRVLMPLAEYLPFSLLAPLVKAYGLNSFFTHGKEGRVFQGKVPLAPSICYEETFPEKVREGRKRGAKILVNLTNDGWYPFSKLPQQHFEHARLRALENGAPVLRACNTGITAAIDSLGQVVGKLDQGTENQLLSGALLAQIDPYEYITLFTLWGNGGILGVSFLFLTVFLFCRKRYQL